MQGSFIPAFGSSSSRPFGSAHFKARREALTRVLTAGFVLPDASGSWSSAALCAHPGLIPIRLSSGALIGRTAPEWADKISRMPGMTKHQTGLRLDAAHLLDFGIAMRAAHLSQGWREELLDLFSLSESAQGAASVRLERALYRPLGALTARFISRLVCAIPSTNSTRFISSGSEAAPNASAPACGTASPQEWWARVKRPLKRCCAKRKKRRRSQLRTHKMLDT